MWMRKKHKNEVNKGKICKEEGCNYIAKAKGYCCHCYIKNYQNKMNTKKNRYLIEDGGIKNV